MEKLKTFWETKVPKEHKHFAKHMEASKVLRQINFFTNHGLKHIDNPKMITALDWGCGGGVLTQVLCDNFKKTFVTDISEESIKEAIRHTDCAVEGILNPYNEHEWHKFDIDMVLCYAVIWHFPNIDYFKMVLDIWTHEIKPSYIVIQVKELPDQSNCPSISQTEEGYYQSNNYVSGLLLSKDETVRLLKDRNYYLTSHKTENTLQGAPLGHYVFKKTKAYNKGGNGVHCKVIYDEKFRMGKGSTYNDYFWCNARGGVTIGENTLFGPHVTITSTNHVIKNIGIDQNASDGNSWNAGDASKRIEYKPIVIGDDCWIGAGCHILAGSIIPDKCVIGAGSIITESNCKQLKKGDIVVTERPLKIIGNRKNHE